MKAKMKTRQLTEEQIEHKKTMLEQEKIKLEELKLQEDQMEKIIEKKLPEKKARAQLNSIRNEIEVTERNIKIIEKQIRERQESILE